MAPKMALRSQMVADLCLSSIMPARAFAISQLLPPDLPDMGEDLLLRPPLPLQAAGARMM